MAVLEQCGAALCNLSFEHDGMRDTLGELGACRLLSDMCHACRAEMPSHRPVLQQACAALGNICKKNRNNRIRMEECAGAEHLARVLATTIAVGPTADAVALQAVRAVGNVVMKNEENQDAFARAGGPKVLIKYCFATRDDAMLRWVLAAVAALATHDLIRYQLVSEHGALAAVARAQAHASSRDTLDAAERALDLLPPPTPMLGGEILREVGESVAVECLDGAWTKAHTVVVRSQAGVATALSSRFSQGLLCPVKDLELVEGSDGRERRKCPAASTRIRLRVRDREVTVDAILDGPGPEDVTIGPDLLVKLKALGFEHMIDECIAL